MQNKKSLLKRLLFIYIAFFLVIVAGIIHNVLGDFGRGAETGMKMGEEIAARLQSGDPRMIYLLGNIHIIAQPELDIQSSDKQINLKARISQLELFVDEPAENSSPIHLALHSVGGSIGLYLLTLLAPLLFIAIIVLMVLIIHSLRRSIRQEKTLDRRNVRCLRAIGVLTILSELVNALADRIMNLHAARLLDGSGFTVDTGFQLSYTMIIMGILILFSAEVFAIGQNLSEEQKLTI